MLREILGDEAPPDLAGAIARATARNREERTRTVRELHDEVLAHLEGARERERRRAVAAEKVAEGKRLSESLADLRARRAAAGAEAAALEAGLRAWTGLEEKRRAWQARDRAASLRNDLLDAFGAAHGAFTGALAMDPDCAPARAGLAALYWDKFLESEAAGDADGLRLCRRMVEQWDCGAYAERLRGDGAFAVLARRFPCDCLRTRGRHTRDCRSVPLDGAHAWLFAWRERDRRLVPSRPEGVAGHASGPVPPPMDGIDVGEGLYLGRAPLGGIRIPMGSWLLVLAADGHLPARVPFVVGRLEGVRVEATMWPPDEVPAGFVPVAGGSPLLGADPALGPETPERRSLPDFFFARLPVTNAEYLAYLNELAAWDPEAAAARAPRRDSDMAIVWPRGPDGLYRLPEAGTAESWLPAHPVTGIAWGTASDYASWMSRRLGRAVALPSDSEWEYAARGSDQRAFPWGNHLDPSFCNCRETHPDGARLLPAGSMPADESPFGVRDLAGNAACWCRNPAARTGDWKAMRGGASMNAGALLRSAYSFGMRPNIVRPYVGIRLVVHPVPPHDSP
jgi:serine/threonine-protein kinase